LGTERGTDGNGRGWEREDEEDKEKGKGSARKVIEGRYGWEDKELGRERGRMGKGR